MSIKKWIMTKPKFKFEIGERTTDIWCGDDVTECEFIMSLPYGQMIFYDIKHKLFRRVYIAVDHEGVPYMDGWTCSECPSKLLKMFKEK